MNSTVSTELLEAGLLGLISYDLLQQVADETSTSPPELLDRLARHVAIAYASNAMSFDEADRIMNASFAAATSKTFSVEHDCTMPDVMFEVYLAFDAGEYHHPGDDESSDPEVLYTQPLVKQFLAKGCVSDA